MADRNLLRRIEDFANDLAKDYANIHLVPRGTPVFADQNLRGTVRFGRRAGNFLPVLAADNSTELATDVVPPADALSLTRIPAAFTRLGAVLDIGPGRELVRVADIDDTTGIVQAESPLRGTNPAGTQVDLYGVPIEVIGNHALRDQVIQIRSSDIVVAGDEIALETTPGVLSSTVATRITNAQYLGTGLDGRFNYEVTLATGISRTLLNEDEILLRGQAAYESANARVRATGPFVVDFVSGSFFDTPTVTEYLSIRALNSLGDPLVGFTDFLPVGKNFPIVTASIRSDSMLFWRRIIGTQQYRDGRFVAITNTDNKFAISEELVPAFGPGHEWEIPVRANGTVLVGVRFVPNAIRRYSLVSGVTQRIRVGIGASEQPSNRVEVVVTSQRPNVQVEFNDWLPTESAVQTIQYQMTSTAYGSNVWQASSLVLKPYFFTLDDIRAQYDSTSYDQGAVYL